MKRQLAISALAGALSLQAGLALAQDDKRAQDRLQTQSQDQIYGSQLMTQQERAEYQARMRSANTDAERERIRQEHHERMKERAKARGVTLPDQPPGDRGGMGSGRGVSPGGGMGSGGSGMGSGGGRSR